MEEFVEAAGALIGYDAFKLRGGGAANGDMVGHDRNEAAEDGEDGVLSGTKSDPFPPSDSPVWISGEEYSTVHDRDELLSLVRSRLWCTYRRDFAEIGSSGLTSDTGWGCMLRCGQMVVAEAMQRLHLGKDWRWLGGPDCGGVENDSYRSKYSKYRSVRRLFSDTESAPYGVHRIALTAESATDGKKKVGTWLGPNTVAHFIRRLSLSLPPSSPDSLNVQVAMDNHIILDDVRRGSCEGSGDGDTWLRPLLLFVPVRLGVSELNPVYFQDLKDCFEIPQVVGVIGGRPNHALYFLGCSADDDHLVYLDPHTTQDAVLDDDDDDSAVVDATFHTDRAGRMHLGRLDPSMALCFFCASESELDDLVQRLLHKLVLGRSNPLFVISRHRPAHMMQEQEEEEDQGGAAAATAATAAGSDDEFELL